LQGHSFADGRPQLDPILGRTDTPFPLKLILTLSYHISTSPTVSFKNAYEPKFYMKYIYTLYMLPSEKKMPGILAVLNYTNKMEWIFFTNILLK
jgi:hypothetical protein